MRVVQKTGTQAGSLTFVPFGGPQVLFLHDPFPFRLFQEQAEVWMLRAEVCRLVGLGRILVALRVVIWLSMSSWSIDSGERQGKEHGRVLCFTATKRL